MSSPPNIKGYQPHPFRPRRGLTSGHAQTIAAAFLPRELTLPPQEERLITVEPGAQVLCHCHWQPQREQRPALVLVHGLEGSSSSQYVRGTTIKAWKAGFSVVRMNIRNCGRTEHLCATLYHSGLSGDVAAVVRELIASDRPRKIFVAGFSMGGNQVLKMTGELGREAPPELAAVAAVCPGVDLSASADALHLPSNRVYEYWFLWWLRQSLKRKQRAFPDRFAIRGYRWLRSMRDFDDVITAANFGFSGAEDYYTRASASPVLERIAVPTLVLHAKDDPFIRFTEETRRRLQANPQITLVEPEHGGHCAFLAEPDGYDGRWAERELVNFFLAQTAKEQTADPADER